MKYFQPLLLSIVLLNLISCDPEVSPDKIELWSEKVNKETVTAFEKEQRSTLVMTRAGEKKDGTLDIYIRDQSVDLPLKVRYYSSKEGQVDKIMYEWSKLIPDLTNTALDSIMNEESNYKEKYNRKFNQVAEQLKAIYQVPVSGDGHIRKERFEMLDMWKREYKWKKGKQHIKLNMIWVPKMGYRVFKVYCEATWEE